mmetsp:Transcript_1233/g.1248  ORF Transcript_1233/g.1248 Transcript_1233/m.1248 type:complete len:994 (+) Transcript_1233:159-3140(+)
MPTPRNDIQGISFISLITNKNEVFEESANFYNKLGFRLTKNFSKITNNSESKPKLQIGISNDSLKELWLESFPLQNTDENGCVRPWQELPVYNGDGCEQLSPATTVKIRLSSLDDLSNMTKELNFFTSDLPRVKDILSNDLKTEIESSTDTVVRVVDPMGNTLNFSNIENPLSEKSFDSPDDYLKYKTEKILASLDRLGTKDTKDEPTETIKKKKIAVMTSGGDAPGMNSAVRAVVRAGIYYGCDVFAVYEGYEGLVQGGDLLRKMEWADVRSYLSLGGTAIGTARCAKFRERSGRLAGAHNMILNGIDALIVCGGDGSLTGADLFRSEWPSLVDELVSNGTFTTKEVEPYRHLTMVGLVGSIDNDMASTDSTIGAYSALERITEMVDYIDATASSHSRAFIVEVMGRHCGWLGLMAGLATGADFIFIPERPPKAGQWENELKDVCLRHRQKGKRNTTVIIAEGAIDDDLNPITPDQVQKVLVSLGLDTRITTLGHVQRGGTAVAYDRLLATLQGVDAVKAVLELTPDDPSPMIGSLENKIVRKPLIEAVKLTKSVATAIENKDFDKAMSLRDSSFEDAYHHFLSSSIYDDGLKILPEEKRLNIGVVHVGASSSGLNAATRAAALYCMSKGHKLFAIQNGFSGLINEGEIKELSWLDVEGWHNKGGSEIGTNRSLPSEDFGNVAYYFQKYNLQGLIIIGGFESFTALHELDENKHQYPIFNIPMVVIPATVSNNVPGTEYSLGGDTCMNQLVKYCDAVKQSASSSRRRVFVVEVQGGHSGFVASYCGLITGSLATYTPESKMDLKTIQEDIDLLYEVFQDDRGEYNNGKMIIRNEQASSVYTTELIADIIKESAGGRFETRTAVPGHVQQGFTPTSMDRVNACRFAVKSCQFIEDWNKKLGGLILDMNAYKLNKQPRSNVKTSMKHIIEQEKGQSSAVVLGIQGAQIKFNSVKSLFDNDANIPLRKGRVVHWTEMIEVADMLSGRLLLREKKH